jgi:hypothetical protein
MPTDRAIMTLKPREVRDCLGVGACRQIYIYIMAST